MEDSQFDLPQPNFQRNQEDFVCVSCGHEVKGTGYTNHCPKCFTSLHVDVQPGDRLADCGGVMKPIEIWFQTGEWHMMLQCEKCSFKRPNRIQPGDDMDALATLQADIAGRFARGLI